MMPGVFLKIISCLCTFAIPLQTAALLHNNKRLSAILLIIVLGATAMNQRGFASCRVVNDMMSDTGNDMDEHGNILCTAKYYQHQRAARSLGNARR